jgi:DNA-binding NarL/FixJ family response regulator
VAWAAHGRPAGRTSAHRVVLADDDVLFREGLAALLERSGHEVVGQAGSGRELRDLVAEDEPDLAVIDIRMPPVHATEGLDVARSIRAEKPQTAILLLSAHVEVEEASGTSTSSSSRSTGSSAADRSSTRRSSRNSSRHADSRIACIPARRSTHQGR